MTARPTDHADRPGPDGRGTGTPARWRTYAAAAVAVVAPAALALMISPLRHRLPEPLPTHWSGTRPDGFTSFAGFTTTLLVVSSLAALAALGTMAVPRLGAAARRGCVAACTAVAWGATALWITVVGIAVDMPDPQVELTWSTSIFGVPAALAPFVLVPVALASLAAYMIFGRTVRPAPVPGADDELPVAELGPGERVHWTQRIASPVLTVAAIAPALGAVVLLAAGLPITIAVALGILALVGATLGSARVVVDRTGLLVRAGLLGWPRKRVPLDEIVRATATTIRPREWGGWGYRVTPGRSALVLRAGPGLVVDLVDGRRFAVTVDDPETPAGLLNALRERVDA